MADAPAVAPAAPAVAPTQTTAPQPTGATVTTLKTHHSAHQPREVGKFAGPPQPPEAPAAEPQKPKAWKLGDVEITDPDELYAVASERVVDHSAFEAAQRELAELRRQAQQWKEPTRALTPAQKAQIAREQLEEFARQEQEAKLPPEQRDLLQQRREFQRQKAEFEAERQRELQTREQQQEQADREALVGGVRQVLRLLGADERPSVTTREVLAEMRQSLLQGKAYPPEVIARRVQLRLEQEGLRHAARVAKVRPTVFVSTPEIVEALNSLEDPEVLQKLAPLIERGRRLNLERLGATPAPPSPQSPPSPGAALPLGRPPRTDGEWVAWFRAGNAPSAPQEYQAQQRLRAAGKL